MCRTFPAQPSVKPQEARNSPSAMAEVSSASVTSGCLCMKSRVSCSAALSCLRASLLCRAVCRFADSAFATNSSFASAAFSRTAALISRSVASTSVARLDVGGAWWADAAGPEVEDIAARVSGERERERREEERSS